RWGRLLTGGVDEEKEGGEAILWDVAEGKKVKLRSMTQLQRVEQVAFDPEGRRFLTRSNYEARLWNVNTGRPFPFPPLKHDDLVLFSAGDPQGGWLPVGGIKREQELFHAAFSPDGRRVLTTARDGVKVWDAATGQPLL